MRIYNLIKTSAARALLVGYGLYAPTALAAPVQTAPSGLVNVTAEQVIIEGFRFQLSNGVEAVHDLNSVDFATATLHQQGLLEFSGSLTRPIILSCGDKKQANNVGVISNFDIAAEGGCTGD